MTVATGQPASSRARPTAASGGHLALEHLAGQVDHLHSLLGEIVTSKFPSLEAKLETVRELLAGRRKEHFVVEEFAELIGRSSYTVRRWISEGKLHAIRIRDGGPRGRLLIPRNEVERLIAAARGGDIPDAVLG
jgi:excisionase family DNA binding protein